MPQFRNISCLVFALVAMGCPDDSSERLTEDEQNCVSGKCDAVGDQTFEFIVVGSGAGGGPVAANLARNGHRVLLLEAGQDEGDDPNYQVPGLHGNASEDPDLRWDYFVDHYTDEELALRDSKMSFDEAANPKGILYPRGGTLGGSTAVNAMITVKPHDRDWDEMAALTGDATWGAPHMEPYFERVQRWLGIEMPNPRLLLFNLRLQQIIVAAAASIVNDTNPRFDIRDLLKDIGQLIGLLTKDINEDAAAKEGMYLFPQAIVDGRRNGSREYLLRTVEEGYPLTIVTGALVHRVIFDDERTEDGALRVAGVEYMRGAHLYEADPRSDLDVAAPAPAFVAASREVILAAGAFNTPQILSLSGIGPADELETLGQDVLLDRPGVGQNLQDRYEVGVVGSVNREFSMLRDCLAVGDESDPCFRKWLKGRGPYETNGVVTAILKRSDPAEPVPNLAIFGLPASFRGYFPGYSDELLADGRHFTWAVLQGHTENRAGSVELRSLDPRRTPDINFRFFGDGDRDDPNRNHDLQAMVEGVQFVREIQKTTNRLMVFEHYEEEVPGDTVDTRDEVEEFIESEAWGHHACCTVKMGDASDPMAVLDSRFRVRGTEGLRVVDASIFPRIPGFFIALPIYMASEKATDVILEDWGETRIEANMP